MWGTTGIGYNPVMVKKALGTDTIDSWSAMLDPAIRGEAREVRHHACSIPRKTSSIRS